MNKAEQLLEDLKQFLPDEVIEEDAEEGKCPKCGSEHIKETMDGMICDDCGETWEKEKEKEDKKED